MMKYIGDYTKLQNRESVSLLEKQLLESGKIYVPDIKYGDGTEYLQAFAWPKTIDGFNPDISGIDFESFQENILNAAEIIDDEKTRNSRLN
jgi:hypothetical protein